MRQLQSSTEPSSTDAQSTHHTVLVVDDSRMQRRILSSMLRRWGYDVVEAGSGEEALKICQDLEPDIVLSDWMMPNMTGIEFCQQFRALPRDSYGYFVLLTSKNDSEEVALGLESGADDFLTKPPSPNELRARLRAGDRILQMQEELVEKNRLVSETLDEISALYESLDNDLKEARLLQQSLVKERFRAFGKTQISLLLRPSGHVGGDLVGFFPIAAQRIGIFAIDVSGHGVSSALMTVRLAGFLSGSSPDQNVALVQDDTGLYGALEPAALAKLLNQITLDEIQTEHYFTLAYADVDMSTGHVRMVQAGHPHPVLQHPDGSTELLGEGGVPIGLVPDIDYTDFDFTMKPGDRLLIASDGITECPDHLGNLLDDDGLQSLMRAAKDVRGLQLMDRLMDDLSAYARGVDFPDDVSAVLFEYEGSSAQTD